MIHFRKSPAGYAFNTSAGRTFETIRGDDGQWLLYEVHSSAIADGRYAFHTEKVTETRFATRTDAAAHAEWLDRDFWEFYDRQLVLTTK